MTRKPKTVVALALAAVALAAVTGTASAVECYLRAAPVSVTMPDATSVPMWGFALEAAFGNELGAVTVPGPLLTVPSGDSTLTIHLDNNLPVPISLVIPGQKATMTPVRHVGGPFDGRVRSFTHETPPGNTAAVDYTWTDVRPGTFIYHSGTHPAIQVQMGLYGGVTKNHAAGAAYDGVTYDAEVVLFYSEIDPALHNAVQGGTYGPGGTITSPVDYAPKYFLINGQPFNGTVTPIAAGSVGQRVLVRFLNAGLRSHAPAILNQWMTPVAEDGFPRQYPTPRSSLTLEALKTRDVILEPDEAGTFPVVDRTLHLTNAAAPGGGMLAHLQVSP